MDHTPDHTPLASSNLKSAAYDPATRTLEVTFANGGTYQYLDVDQHHHANLLKHPSPGGYLHSHIKPHHTAKKAENP